jgi:nucleoside-diphosphate-sugar epimerase
MKTLITGATGFLGRRLVAELAPRHDLRVLVRPLAGRGSAGFPPGVEVFAGDVTDAASLRRAVEGCDAVVHGAALVKILAPAAAFDRINVAGFDSVLDAAAAAGVARMVYVSSFMALGPSEGAPGGMLDESAANTPEAGPAAAGGVTGGAGSRRRWINDYERTKTLADRLARRAIAAGRPLNVVYPAVIYGPGEMTEGNLVVRHLLDLLHRRLPALLGTPGRRWSYVYVDDVARGIGQVLERAPAGGRYVLGGDNVTLGDFYGVVEELSGVQMPRRRLPDGLAKTIGAAQKTWARLRRNTPALTPDLVEVYRHDWAYSSAHAAADLGYSFRRLREGLAASLAWLRETRQWQR